MRETQGISSDLHQRAFPRKMVRTFTMRPPVKQSVAGIEHVVIAIDPSGGGSSHFAVVSAWFREGLMGICGLESVHAKSPDVYASLLLKHCAMLRRAYPRALFIICPEANLGFESSYINKILQPVEFTVTMFEARSGVPGMHTTHQSKEVMHSLLLERLQDKSIAYAEPFITTHTVEKIKQKLNTQVSNYSIIVDVPDKMTQHFKFSKKTFGGKMHGNDDMCVMLQFNILARKRFFGNAKYRAYF